MTTSLLTAISPIDGRYCQQTAILSTYFSEYALIKYRVHIEIEYFIALCQIPLPQLSTFDSSFIPKLRAITSEFSLEDAAHIKSIEAITNHDVKAVEYFLREQFESLGLGNFKEFIHFGLTSQDINNTAVPYSYQLSLTQVLIPEMESLVALIKSLALTWKGIPMLAHTHGQAASPTTVGKEFEVFVERLTVQIKLLKALPIGAKFGGATGNFNAHAVAYPQIKWVDFANTFVNKTLQLTRQQNTTQIEHYDNLAASFDNLKRINTILIDLCRDIWTYISMNYFKQKVKANEVGSSAMPHKVNPIDFENAEGNLGIANALFEHLAAKLPLSRLQRDLTDSTVIRNIGVPVAHTLISFNSITKGLNKLIINEAVIDEHLNQNWAVIAEAIQTILRRENYPNPYDALKNLTRGNQQITKQILHDFVDQLNTTDDVKMEMKKITPQNYIGVVPV